MTTLYNNASNDWSGQTYDNGLIDTMVCSDLDTLKDRLKVYGIEDAEHFEDNRYCLNYTDDNNDLIDLSFYFYEVIENEIKL
jgi:hypothetical protein